jgi:hypothetical protein
MLYNTPRFKNPKLSNHVFKRQKVMYSLKQDHKA